MTDVEKAADRSEDTISTLTVPGSGHPEGLPDSSGFATKSQSKVDGGLNAWLTLVGSCASLFCAFGQMSAFGTFQTYYADHQLQHLSASTISWIGSVQFWVFFFSGGFIGRLFDAVGPRPIIFPGAILLSFSSMMTSLSSQYYQFMLAQGILFGGSVGLVFFPSLAALSTHFVKRRGTAMGIAFASAGLGGVIYPIMFQRLFNEVGYAWTVRIDGFLSLFLGLIASATITSTRTHGRSDAPLFDMKTFRDVRFMTVCLGCMIVGMSVFIPFFYLADYAEDHGIDQATAFYILSVINAGGIVGRLSALLSDRFGRYNMIVPSTWLMGICGLLFWMFATTLVEIVWFGVLWGIFSGTFIAMMIPCIGEISQIDEIGLRIGILYSTISFGTLAGAPAAGALIKDAEGSYRGAIGLCGATAIVGGFFLLWVRFRLDQRIFVKV